jgi:hypothetical protein
MWRAWSVRKGIGFSKTEQMRKIVVGLIINNLTLKGEVCCSPEVAAFGV